MVKVTDQQYLNVAPTLVLIGPRRFQAVAIRAAIKLYRDTGLRANMAYTPANLKRTAENITGKKFKARDWDSRIDALGEML